MFTLRKAAERGKTQTDWLDSRHSFSFGEYRDAQFMGFGSLRVINEDRVSPAKGFATHGHRDMEIVTYVLEGELEHKDSLGNGSIIKAGDVQRMSAGTGVLHSEFNPSPEKATHFIQIWIIPERTGLPPSYEQANFGSQRKAGAATLLASRDGEEGGLTLHQDAKLSVLDLDKDQGFILASPPNRLHWLQIARGAAMLDGTPLSQGDGVAISAAGEETLVAQTRSEILIFDLAAL